jgi:L-ascorbate metabolism protein UlaG (beta-lactamase superfamily)
MKRFFAIFVFCLFTLPIGAGTMVRVARVIDSRTIVLDGGTTVTLRGVDIPPADEAMAAGYLRSTLGNNWVLVENGGDVYRSPDALYVNGQLIMHAYRGTAHMKVLGESMPAPRAHAPAPRATAPLRSAPPRRAPHRPQRGFVPKKRGV